MTNSFDRFDINHLSPNSLNDYIESQGWWTWKYVGKFKDSGGPAMWRGLAVDDGLKAMLHGLDFTMGVTAAYQAFDLNTLGELTDEIEAERNLILPMLEQLSRWVPPSDLMASQLKVEYWFDSIPIPAIGYLDFAFETGIDIDLKTTKACPSTPRERDVRQVSFYRAARGRKGGILYVTDKKHRYFDVTDEMMEQSMKELQEAALAISHFLARMESKEAALRSTSRDWSHWKAPKQRMTIEQLLNPTAN